MTAALACALAVGALAQAQPQRPPGLLPEDAKTLHEYALTDANVKKLIDVDQRLAAAIKKDPSLTPKLAQHQLAGARNIDESIKAIEQNPDLMKLLKSAKLTARDYLLATLGLIQGATIAQAKKQHPDLALPETVNPANVTYAEKHEALVGKWAALMQEIGRASQAAQGTSKP